jgi:hypothetical protein
MPTAKSLLAALLATSVVLLGAAPALAGSEIVRDPGGDVRVTSAAGQFPATEVAPRHRVGDIVGGRVSFGRDLVITMRFRSLDARHRQEDFEARIRTSDDHDPWVAVLSMAPGQTPGLPPFFFVLDPQGDTPGCGSGHLRRATRTVTITLPASCLGNPRWVKVAGYSVFHQDPTHVYYDDARSDGVVDGHWTYGPRLTPG